MASKDIAGSSAAELNPLAFLDWGQERTAAALALQKEVLEAYDRASRDWLARVQSEVSLWSDLAARLTATRNVPEALETYTKCVSERIKMVAEDGRRLTDEAHVITQKIAKSLNGSGRSAPRT